LAAAPTPHPPGTPGTPGTLGTLLVFDLDGTLIDSVGDLAASASELVTSLGGRALDQSEVAAMVGDGAAQLVRRALEASGLPPDLPGALSRFLDIYDRRLLDTTVAYAGIPEALMIVSRRARLAVLTNKPLGFSRRILDALALSPAFDAVIGGDGPYPRKPDPAGLRALMSASTRVLMVGDSPIDWTTASAGGCSFAWARYGFGAARFDGDGPDTPYRLDRPSDLVEVVDRFIAVTAGA
jgi:phosphoglycolate phosphatase